MEKDGRNNGLARDLLGLLERRWPRESYPVREHSDYKKEVKLETEL